MENEHQIIDAETRLLSECVCFIHTSSILATGCCSCRMITFFFIEEGMCMQPIGTWKGHAA